MNDEELGYLLGGAPVARDPVFRVEVFERIAHNAQRRQAQRQAIVLVVVSSAIGVAFALTEASGLIERAQPLFLSVAAAALSYMVAAEAGKGRRSIFGRWLADLRLYRL